MLSPVEEVIQSVSKEMETLSVVIPNIPVLLWLWEKQDNNQGIYTIKEELIKSLKSSFAGIKENRLLSITTMLNPRFKDKFFASNITKTTLKEMLDKKIAENCPW